MSTVEGYVVLHRTSDEAEAGFISSMLQQVGIRSIVQQEPPSFVSTQPSFLVLVHASQFPEAKQMLAEQLLEEGEAVPWPETESQRTQIVPRSAGLPQEETSTWRFLILLAIAVVILLILGHGGRR